MARVFISYKHGLVGSPLARALHRRLSELEHDVFLDEPDIPVGASWDGLIKDKIRRAEYFIAMVSTEYLYGSTYIDAELKVADEQREKGQLAEILPINMAFDGDFPELVRKLLEGTQAARWRSPDDTSKVVEEIAAHIPRPVVLVKGMLAFQQADRDAFRELGREADLDRCQARLGEARGCLLIHGISGAGKTSFLNAGLIPRLAGRAQVKNLDEGVPATFAGCLVGAAPDATTVIIDQFERWTSELGRDPEHGAERAAALVAEILAWTAADPARRVVFCVRDEYRTAFDEAVGGALGRPISFALLAFAPLEAARVLARLLDDARVEHHRPFLDDLCAELAEGDPRCVRPALLQLIAQEYRHGGGRFDRGAWQRSLAGGRTFFEAHVRRAVLDHLPRSLPRVDTTRALHALTAGELKSSPRSIDDIVADERLPAATVRRTLDMAGLAHARVVTEAEGRYQLVHDLFARAIDALHEEAKRNFDRFRRLVTRTTIALLGAAILALAAVAFVVVRDRGEESQRREEANRAKDRARRQASAANLAAYAQASLADSPQRSVLLSVEALAATGDDPPLPVAEQNLRDALQATGGGRALIGHEGPVWAVALSEDGRIAATGGEDGRIRVWDLTADDPFASSRLLTEQTATIRFLAIAGGGRWLVANENHGALRLWDLKPREPTSIVLAEGAERVTVCGDRSRLLASIVDPDRVGSNEVMLATWDLTGTAAPATTRRDVVRGYFGDFAIGEDGRFVATLEDRLIRVWDLARPGKPKEVRPPAEDHVYERVAIDASGQLLATRSQDKLGRGGAEHLTLWSLAAGRQPKVVQSMSADPLNFAFAPDGKLVVLAAGRSFVLTPTEVSRGDDVDASLRELTFSFSPNSWLVAGRSESDGKAVLEANAALGSYSRHVLATEGWPQAFAFDRSGAWLIVGSGAAHVWNVRDPDALNGNLIAWLIERPLDVVERISAVSPDGKWIALVGPTGVGLWRLAPAFFPQQALSVPFGERRDAAAFTAGGRHLLLWAEKRTLLWRLDGPTVDAKPIRLEPAGPPADEPGGELRRTTLSPDGRWIAVSGPRRASPNVWDLSADPAAAAPRALPAGGEGYGLAGFSPDGRWFVAADHDQDLFWIWDLGAPELPPRRVACRGSWDDLLFAATSRRLLLVTEEEACLVDLAAPDKPPATIPSGPSTHVFAFSADGDWLAGASRSPTVGPMPASVWDLRGGAPAQVPLASHVAQVTSFVFGKSGPWLAILGAEIGEEEGKLGAPQAELLDLSKGGTPTALSVGSGGAPLRGVFSPDDRWFAITADFSGIRLWDLHGGDLRRPAYVLPVAGACMTFRPDSRTFVAAASISTNVWDLALLGESLQGMDIGPAHLPDACEYRQDGTLLTQAWSGQVALWAMRRDQLLANARRSVGRNLGWSEWREAFGDAEYRKTFAQLPVPADVVTGLIEAHDYPTATRYALERDGPRLLAQVCRCGEDDGAAPAVKPACERAVALGKDPASVTCSKR